MRTLAGLYSEKSRIENLLDFIVYEQNYITDNILDSCKRQFYLEKTWKKKYKLQKRYFNICDDIQTLTMRIEKVKRDKA